MSGMRMWQVARRDYLETVRSGSFLIMLLIVPAILVGSIAIPRMLERHAEPSRFALVDLPVEWRQSLDRLYRADEGVARQLELTPMDTPAGESAESHLRSVQSQVRSTKLDGYVGVETVDGERRPFITARTLGDDDGRRWLNRNLSLLVRSDRASRMGLSSQQVASLNEWVDIHTNVLSAETGEAKVAGDTERLAAFAPVIFTYLLWIVVFTLTQRLLMSTIEEKSNRTIEVILSSMSPMEFMGGKVLSGVLEGITVLTVWLGCLFLAADYFTQRYMKGLDLTVLFHNKAHLAMFAVYFAMGYVLFAALIVGMGSLCNTIKDTQGLMTPVMLVMTLPIIVMMYVQQHPSATLSVVLSWIPFFTPFLMMTRVAAQPPPGMLEIGGSFLLLLLAIYGTTWMGAKLFRVGILMYGKPPRPSEIIRILTSPQGRVAARVS